MSNDFLVKAINLALALLCKRVFTFLSIMLIFALFAWCLYEPSLQRTLASSIFGLICLVYIRMDNEPPKGE